MKRWGLSMGVSPREPLKNVSDLAAAADAKGFDSMWFIDFQLGMKDVYAAMNLAALSSKNLHIGSAVTNLTTRHPTVTANATAALDELSNGHARLGLGAGWSAVYGAGGQPSTLAQLSEGIDELRALFTGEEQELYGRTVKLATATRQIPIYLAVSQPGITRLCGRKADGAILMGAADPVFINWQLEHLYEGLEKAGRKRSDIKVDLVVTMSIDDDEEKAMDAVGAWATSQAATFKVWKQMPPGYEKFRPEFEAASAGYHLVNHLSRHAEHKRVVSDEFIKSVTISGNKQYCIDRLKELVKLDIDGIIFPLLSGGRKKNLDMIADEIIPAVNAK